MARNVSTAVSASGFVAAVRFARSVAAACPASEKPTTSAPPPLSKSRREGMNGLLMTASPDTMSAARLTARTMRTCVPQRHRLPASACLISASLGFGFRGEEGGRLHDHAVDAVAALHRLLLDEGALHRVQIFRRAQPFQRDDLVAVADRGQRQHARAHGLAVDVHGAGAALREAAAEARPVQSEIVAQHIEQRHVRDRRPWS